MQCQVCGGKGLQRLQRGLDRGYAGQFAPSNVLRAAGLDPDEYTGFYVNIGLDRLVMMRYSVDDVRLFHSGDLRFLETVQIGEEKKIKCIIVLDKRFL